MSSRFSHVVVCVRIVFPFKAEYYSIVCTDHILCIRSSVDGHLVASTFWLLWIMLLWTGVYRYLFKILLSFWGCIYPKVELLGYSLILFLMFWETTILFSVAAAPFYIPTNSAQVSSFSTSSPLVIFWSCFCFDSSYPYGSENHKWSGCGGR